MQVYVICSLQIVFYVFLCYSFVCYSFALYAFVFYVFVLHAFVFYAFVFYALYSMHYILCKLILKLVTGGPTDRPTDGQTLPGIELLSQLKIMAIQFLNWKYAIWHFNFFYHMTNNLLPSSAHTPALAGLS